MCNRYTTPAWKPQSRRPAETPSVSGVTPDFVIVGNQKSGTTALFTYLGGHPGVAVSSNKEPCFWSSDLPRKGKVSDRAEYLALWDGAPEGALRGEASTNYILSEVAIPAIRRENPHARMIVMLRNPVDMAAALHSEFLNSFEEDVGDFERAWRLQERRRKGQAIPPECVDPDGLQYERTRAIGTQLERFFAMVPESHRMTVVFDDLERQASSVYRQVLDFLGLDHDGRSASTRSTRTGHAQPRLAAVHRDAATARPPVSTRAGGGAGSRAQPVTARQPAERPPGASAAAAARVPRRAGRYVRAGGREGGGAVGPRPVALAVIAERAQAPSSWSRARKLPAGAG